MNAVTDDAYNVTADELRQFIERVEHLEAEKRDIADQIKEVMAEAKGRGYDTAVIRKIISLRRRDKNDVAEEERSSTSTSKRLGWCDHDPDLREDRPLLAAAPPRGKLALPRVTLGLKDYTIEGGRA